jgi:hypothetical protein
MKKIFTKFILLLTLVSFFNNAFAEVKVYSLYNPQIPISTTQTAISTTSTTSKKFSKNYKLPKMFTFVKINDANFEIFPKQIQTENFFNASSTASSTILAISRKWQTACLYNASGTFATVSGYKMCFQAGTGKPIKQMFKNELTNLETPLGLFQIQSKKDKDYTSQTYTSDGKEIEKIMLENKILNIKDVENAAPMPYAMHIGQVVSLKNNKVFGYLFSDGTAIHEKQTATRLGAWAYPSHGCVAVPKNYGKYLQSSLQIGDLVMIFEEDFPTSLTDSLETGLMSRVR